MVIELRRVVTGMGGCSTDWEGTPGVLEMLCILIWGVVTQVYTYAKTVPLLYVRTH